MKHNDEFIKDDERYHHEDEFNRDVEFGLNRKDSYEGEEAEMDELNKRRSTKHAKNPLVDKAIGVLKVGAIAVAAVSVVATTSTVHEHHIPNDWTTIVDATCIEYGKEEKRCDDCGKVIDARLINYGEHLAGDWVIEVESNCSHKGSEIQLCQTCDELLNTREIPLGDHVIGEWEELIIKTCTEDGVQVKKCTICNEELEKEIIPASHTEVIDKAVKATCYKTGLTQGSHCSECEKVLVAQKVIPITHSVVVVKGKPATCTESGLTDGQKCSICDAVIQVQQSIAPSHKAVTIKGYPADCGQWTDGLTDGQECSVCGTVLRAQQSIAPSHVQEVYIPNGWPTSPTCEEGVVGMGRCKNCGMETSTYIEISSALGHNYEERLVVDDTGMANTMYICSRCGAVRQ